MVLLGLWLVAALAQDTGTGDTGTLTETADTGMPAETADTGTDPSLDLDQDSDGFTPRQGDCDDAQPAASPSAEEVCEDRIDNDCDGLYDEECDLRVRMATLRGGGGCTGGSAPASNAALGLPLLGLALLRRRIRR